MKNVKMKAKLVQATLLLCILVEEVYGKPSKFLWLTPLKVVRLPKLPKALGVEVPWERVREQKGSEAYGRPVVYHVRHRKLQGNE